jgi:chromosomal replication initiation ATPase DnaA
VTHDDREIVGAIRSALADRIGSDRFDVWFGPSVQFRYDRQTLFVVASQQFVLERIQKSFRADLQGACRAATGQEFPLSFCVESSQAANPNHPRKRRKRKRTNISSFLSCVYNSAPASAVFFFAITLL